MPYIPVKFDGFLCCKCSHDVTGARSKGKTIWEFNCPNCKAKLEVPKHLRVTGMLARLFIVALVIYLLEFQIDLPNLVDAVILLLLLFVLVKSIHQKGYYILLRERQDT